MKQYCIEKLQSAVAKCQAQGIIPNAPSSSVQVERTRDAKHGDYASNIAMTLAKTAKCAPRALAEKLIDQLHTDNMIANISIAGPGFINFKLTSNAFQHVILQVFQQKEQYGTTRQSQQSKVNLEYISANPTGPLHVGHGRSAAYGSSLANLLTAAGFDVTQEYYVNDAGRQMAILTLSVWLRYHELLAKSFTFPSNGYRGEYIKTIATLVKNQFGNRLQTDVQTLFDNVPADEPAGGDKEKHVDALIKNMKAQLSLQNYEQLSALIKHHILDDIKADCQASNIFHDVWFSEKSLFDSGEVDRAIEQLVSKDLTYEKEGALWFNAIHFGDEKDRVLQRTNGEKTYFASDAAYVNNKFNRGFDKLIYIFGADHHGYIARLNAVATALGYDSDKIDIPLVQFATLWRGSEKLSMTTRGGTFVSLKALREEIGNDATRFFYVMRKAQQHMDFDLELAKSQSNDNPVYYIQYAHARICSVMRQLAEKQLDWQPTMAKTCLNQLSNAHEERLLRELAHYPELIEMAAKAYEPHQLAQYLRELANHFHTYYNAHPFLVDDADLRNARLSLINAVKQVIKNGLTILGVNAPEVM